MSEPHLAQETRGDNVLNGRVFINQQKGRIEIYNDSGFLVSKYGWNGDSVLANADTGDYGIVYVDSNGVDKVFQGPKSSGIFEVFFIGILEAVIEGGELDGVTYSTYVLDIFLNHDFSSQYPELTPLYHFWRDSRSTDGGGTFYDHDISANEMGSLDASGGTSTETTSHRLFKDALGDAGPFGAENAETNEFLQFRWIVTRSAGTVTIAPQTIIMIPSLIYFNEPLALAEQEVQGGGGGILYEAFNFYN